MLNEDKTMGRGFKRTLAYCYIYIGGRAHWERMTTDTISVKLQKLDNWTGLGTQGLSLVHRERVSVPLLGSHVTSTSP